MSEISDIKDQPGRPYSDKFRFPEVNGKNIVVTKLIELFIIW